MSKRRKLVILNSKSKDKSKNNTSNNNINITTHWWCQIPEEVKKQILKHLNKYDMMIFHSAVSSQWNICQQHFYGIFANHCVKGDRHLQLLPWCLVEASKWYKDPVKYIKCRCEELLRRKNFVAANYILECKFIPFTEKIEVDLTPRIICCILNNGYPCGGLYDFLRDNVEENNVKFFKTMADMSSHKVWEQIMDVVTTIRWADQYNLFSSKLEEFLFSQE